MEATITASAAKRKDNRRLRDALTYEVVDGKPIYYKGYRQVLNGKLNLESVMAESILQAWLKAQLSALLIQQLRGKNFEILTGELGVWVKKDDYRGADLSIFRSENFVLTSHFTRVPPEVVVEIDVQADLEKLSEGDYVWRKIEDYLQFGVKRIVWIFTASRKIVVATEQKPWLTLDWDATIETVEGATFNLEKMLEGKPIG